MTSAAIQDKILSYGYSTTATTITGVTFHPDNFANYASWNSAGNSAFRILGGEGINTTATDQLNTSAPDYPAITISGEDASDSNKGIVELATTAETTTGTSTTLAVTPDGLKDGYQGSTNITTLGSVATCAGLITENLLLRANKDITPGDGSMLHLDAGTLTDTNTDEGGTAALFASVNLEQATVASGNGDVTITDAATLYVKGPPTAGTNISALTNAYALWVDAGNVRLDGEIYMGSTRAMDSSGLLRVADQSTITGLGTISSGTWQGTAIASAYLDADTAHLSGTQTFSGTKTFSNTISGSIDGNAATVTSGSGSSDANHALLFTAGGAGVTTVLQDAGILYNPSTNVLTASGGFLGNITGNVTGNVTGNCSGTAANVTGVVASANLDADTAHISATKQLTHHGISDDIDSDVVYISLLESDAENTSHSNKHLPIIAPAAGKLLKIFVRTTVDQSSETFTWKLYTRTTSQSTNGAAAEIGAQSGAGPTNKTMVTYDFTTGLDSGTNVIGAGDKVLISLQAGDGSTSNGGYFITCLWEWDLS
jgi:hypothetical protein